jgi:hypothetical protein
VELSNRKSEQPNPKISWVITDMSQPMAPFQRGAVCPYFVGPCPCRRHGCTNPGRLITVATRFFTMASDLDESSVWNLLHVTILGPTILRWLLDFLNICVSLHYVSRTGYAVILHDPTLLPNYRTCNVTP